MNRAIEEGIPILDCNYLANITVEQVKYIFRGCSSTPVPLLDERHVIMNEIGTVLRDKYHGSAVNVIKRANNSAVALRNILVMMMIARIRDV